MIAHQLDLFGGPLKPPKKIKVDDDVPVDDPEEVAPPLPEPEPITAEVDKEEQTLAESLPTEPEAFLNNGMITNDLEWSPDYKDGGGDESPEELVETFPGSSASNNDTEEEVLLPAEENEELAYTNEAIFTPKINDDIQEPQAVPGFIENETVAETTGQDEEPGTAISTPNDTIVPRLKKGDEEDGLNIPADEALFKRQYYSMRETAGMFGVNQSLLRFWENEFDILQPKKNKKGDRYFRPVDIKNLVLIYHLLRVRKFTLEGAKDYLNSHKKAADSFELVRRLEKLKSFLFELKAGL